VDFTGETILINRQLQRERVKGGKLRLVSLKNSKQRRIMPGSELFELLREQKRRQAQQHLLAGSLWTDTGLVFTNDVGCGLDGDAVYKAYKLVLEKAGLPSDLRVHDLRHTAAALILENSDNNYKLLQETLGHHSAGFTLDVYGHITQAAKNECADNMSALLKRARNAG